MILFWHPAGPLLKFNNGTLMIETLNPQMFTEWRMTRVEMLKTGIRFIIAAFLKE